MNEPIEPVAAEDLDGEEGWTRETDEPDVRNVEAYRYEDSWQVTVWVAEFVRDEPLESEFRGAIDAALKGVEGVTSVEEEDREVWAVAGKPSGRELVVAAASVVDGMADRLRPAVDGDE